jgi:hypothetical protein
MNFSITFFFNRILYYIFFAYHFINNIPNSYKKKIEDKNHEKEYLDCILNKFQKYISENGENNINIDPIFYEKKEFNEFMKNIDNSLEPLWKTRILMDFSPRGNIIMFYDAYKLGFAYYCDQNSVSYDILNAIAMKYVITYRCYSFFMDELILPENSNNPLKNHFIEDKKDIQSNESFIKLKNYKSESKQQIKQKETIKNKFIYLGNIRNFKITQSIPKKNINNFHSTLLDGITSNYSYNQFKNLKKKNVTCSSI